MYEFLLSNLLTTFIVGVGLYAYHSYVEYKRQQYYEHLQYKASKVVKVVSKTFLTWMSKYHEMKSADNLETIKELLFNLAKQNNGKIGDNLNTIKDLMKEVTDTTKKTYNSGSGSGFDFNDCLKPFADSFINSSLNSLPKQKSDTPDIGDYVCKMSKIYGDYCKCDNESECKPKYKKHNQCDSDEESCEMGGIKLTI